MKAVLSVAAALIFTWGLKQLLPATYNALQFCAHTLNACFVVDDDIPMREAFRSRSTSVNIANSPCWAAVRWFVLLLSALVSPSALVQPAVERPGTLRVALDNAYAPYSFRLDEGKLQGIL